MKSRFDEKALWWKGTPPWDKWWLKLQIILAEIANDFVLQDSSYRLHGHNQLVLNKAAEANQVLKLQNFFFFICYKYAGAFFKQPNIEETHISSGLNRKY